MEYTDFLSDYADLNLAFANFHLSADNFLQDIVVVRMNYNIIHQELDDVLLCNADFNPDNVNLL